MSSANVKDYTYNEETYATCQRPLNTQTTKPARQSFITLDFGEQCTSNIELSIAQAGKVTVIKRAGKVSLQDLWRFLASSKLPRGKHWMISHRTKWMLDATNWTLQVQAGLIKLPTKKDKDKGTKRAGKLTLTPSTTEIDFVTGRNTIKLLDWWNYGINPTDYAEADQAGEESKSLTILREWIRWTHANDLSTAKTTAAQIGWSKAKATLGRRVCSVNYDHDCRALERQAYFGGRCEPFRLGIIPGVSYSVDVNGCYADICKTCPLPYHLRREYRAGIDLDKIDAQAGEHWIAEVILKTDQPDYPLRWYSSPIYPTGQFRTSLCWPELRHALERGRVVKVLRAAEYLAAPLFDAYAEWFQREKSRIGGTQFRRLKSSLKSIFNRSLGFTARQDREWVPWDCGIGSPLWIGVTASPEDLTTPVRAQIINGQAEWCRIGGEPRDGLPMIHATICSWARIRLTSIIEHAGRENVLYVDTDGLLLTLQGMERLRAVPGLLGSEPGQLVQRWHPGTAIVRGPKNYRMGINVVCSGLETWRHNEWDTTGTGKIELVHDTDTGKLVEKLVNVQLTTVTGRSDSHGKVTPWEMRCELLGELSDTWANEMT